MSARYTIEIDDDTDAVEVYAWDGNNGTHIATVQFPSFDPTPAVLRWEYPHPGFAPRTFNGPDEVLAYVEAEWPKWAAR